VPLIRILPGDLVDQIAAGEVVERPASVVKELIENALDAGARSITVELEQGGVTLLRVTDDGAGMAPEDARLSVQRHATSKIRSKDDLSRIATLGFRGEALPSIASVSRFTLRTRAEGQEAATEIRIDGGGPPTVHEVGAARGTSVEVRDLFYNVPARRKFLKSTATEAAQVGDVCLRAALGDAGLRVVVVRDGRRVRELAPAADVRQRARMLFPDDALDAIEGERDGVHVRAMLSPPERARSGATQLHVYVNGRPVKDRALSRAIAFGYGSLLSGGKYPVGALWLTIDPERVDVNVHPQKAEVRFAGGREVLDAVTRMVASALGASAFRGPMPRPGAPAELPRSPSYWEERLDGLPVAAPLVPEPRAYPTAPAPRQPELAVSDVAGPHAPLRFVAQLRRTFLLCEGEGGVVFLDQHAADERVRFERLARAFRERSVAVQRLLLPERVELAAADVALLAESEALVQSIGLELSPIGENTVAVRAVPALVSRASPEKLVRDLVVELSREGARAYGDRVDRVLATMACHGAIRAGDTVSPEEAQALLSSLARVEHFAGHCPHGRPVVHELSFAELERKVGR
jgi:DNA mismatch repair protein MutL